MHAGDAGDWWEQFFEVFEGMGGEGCVEEGENGLEFGSGYVAFWWLGRGGVSGSTNEI